MKFYFSVSESPADLVLTWESVEGPFNPTMVASWPLPCNTNGVLKHFEVTVVALLDYFGTELTYTEEKLINVNEDITDLLYSARIPAPFPNFQFTVTVNAFTSSRGLEISRTTVAPEACTCPNDILNDFK